MADIPSEWLWIVIVGFIVAFILAFGIGANDVANSFGTSVGAKVLTLVQACVLGTIFETLGAVLIGYKVSDTIRKGIIDVNAYNGTEETLLLGNLSALSGSCVWLLIATFLRLPVSGTHSIVGATVGFSLVAKGTHGISWEGLGMIVASWFVSPLLSGGMTALLFIFVRHFILKQDNQLERGLFLLPVFYGVTVCINALSVFLDGSELLQFDKIPLYGVFILSIGLGIVVAAIVRVFVVPRQRIRIQQEVLAMESHTEGADREDGLREQVESQDTSLNDRGGGKTAVVTERDGLVEHNGVPRYGGSGDSGANDKAPILPESGGAEKTEADKDNKETKVTYDVSRMRENIEDSPETKHLFSFLQILTAIFGSFAHGGNDVSNAVGPLVALWVVSRDRNVEQTAPTPLWVLLYGGVGISVGLWVWGRRVIQTLGEDLSKITPSSGFCIEVGAALTVLVASKVGVPISTTHCKVGSIVVVGRLRSHDNVDWRLFRNIVLSWVVTVPFSAAVSAALMAVFLYAW